MQHDMFICERHIRKATLRVHLPHYWVRDQTISTLDTDQSISSVQTDYKQSLQSQITDMNSRRKKKALLPQGQQTTETFICPKRELRHQATETSSGIRDSGGRRGTCLQLYETKKCTTSEGIRCSNCPTFSNRWLGDSPVSWNSNFASASGLITMQVCIALYH